MSNGSTTSTTINYQLYVRQHDDSISVHSKMDNRYLERQAKRKIRPVQYQRFNMFATTNVQTIPRQSVPGTQTSKNGLLISYSNQDSNEIDSTTTARTWKEWRLQLPAAEYQLVHYFKALSAGTDNKMKRMLTRKKTTTSWLQQRNEEPSRWIFLDTVCH